MYRNSTQRHADAAREMCAAVGALKRALAHEGNLAWAGPIKETLFEAERIAERLRSYAKVADVAPV